MSTPEDDAWFGPKRYGFGAGWPIAWQGWALLAGYLALALATTLLLEWDAETGLIAMLVLLLPATIALVAIAAHKTRGGWRWRWGSDD